MMISDTRGWSGLPQFSRDMYQERYFLEGENYRGWLDRMAKFADDDAMAERIKTYIHNYWFMPSTPVSSNGNAPERGLPISCYVNKTQDSKEGIFDTFTENNWLGSYGGGIGTDWSSVRGIGEGVGANGKSSGIIPFIKVSDSSTLAVSQGGLRRASQAVYLDVSHPEIEEFIDVRRPTGDANRRSLNVHHGVTIPDAFMEAVESRGQWDLISPKTGSIVKTVDAFDLFKKMLVTRMETGEPYMLFKDNVNDARPQVYKDAGYEVTQSNLCAEITLHTNENYTGVCCLASMNLEYWDEIEFELEQFVYDTTRFLDNVLQSFSDLTEGVPGFEKARRSAMAERSLGLGAMGFHSLLQKKSLPWGSPMSKGLNITVFDKIKAAVDDANHEAAVKFGPCPLGERYGHYIRNTHSTSIAPTASISTLCNGTSQGVDPRLANSYVHKTNIGTYTQRNKYLERRLIELGANTDKVWKAIGKEAGSIQNLKIPGLSAWDKEVFKTAIELNQFHTVDMACDRAPYIDQAQSINLFLPADEQVANLYNLHVRAWEQGLKSLYYCRSTAATRASAGLRDREIIEVDSCLSCQ